MPSNKYSAIVSRTQEPDSEDEVRNEEEKAKSKPEKAIDPKPKEVSEKKTGVLKSIVEPAVKTVRVTAAVPIEYEMALKEMKALRKYKGEKVTADDLVTEAFKFFEKNSEFAACLQIVRARIAAYK